MTREARIDNWPLTLKNLFLPIFCRECGRGLLTEENGYFCPTCWELSRRVTRPFCTICGRPHQGREGFGDLRNFPCAKCRGAEAPPFRRAYGAAYYEGAVAQGIKLFKFYGKRRLARPLAEIMEEFAREEMDLERYQAIVPVPLHRVRQLERGYNQSLLLAELLTSVFQGAELCSALRRIRPTQVQSRLKDEKARTANVVGAFAVDRERDFAGGKVLLIDDVVTTGGTVAECARALRRAGAGEVDVFAAALSVLRIT